MATKLSICVDLGSDTLKLVCAYPVFGGFRTVKVVKPDTNGVAIPAAAYYNASTRTWVYGYQLFDGSVSAFDRVVKIKDLLALLAKHKDLTEEQQQDNIDQYNAGKIYAYYDFPVRSDLPKVWSQFCTDPQYENSRFRAEQSPRLVCEGYFAYVYNAILKPFLTDLRRQGVLYGPLTTLVTILCPSRIGDAYTDELQRLVRQGFALAAEVRVDILSPNKALGMLAVYNGQFSDAEMARPLGETALVFHIGEEQISVARFSAHIVDGRRTFEVDGISGHNQPESLGGNNIDKAIDAWFKSEVSGRRSVGDVHEEGTRTGHFYLMRAIKAAKYLLAKDALASVKDYPAGVPIRRCRDAIEGAMLTATQLETLLRADPDVQRIAKYVNDELGRTGNRSTGHVYLAGGAATTCGLLQFLRDYTDERSITLFDLVPNCDIGAHEFQVYAPAIGAAQMGLKGDHIDSVLTRSYGVRVTVKVPVLDAHGARQYDREGRFIAREVPVFKVLARRGELCCDMFKPNYPRFRNNTNSLEQCIYSTAMSPDRFALHNVGDIRMISLDSGDRLFFPNDNEEGGRDYFRQLQQEMDFYVETDPHAQLQLFRGSIDPANLVSINDTDQNNAEQRLFIAIGVQMDSDGYVVPKVEIPLGQWEHGACMRQNARTYSITTAAGAIIHNVPIEELVVAYDREMAIDPGLGRGV